MSTWDLGITFVIVSIALGVTVDETFNNKVTPRSHDPSKYNYNPGMGEKSKWKISP